MIKIAKRVYSQTVIKWILGIAITGGTIIGGYFAYLAFIGAITINGYSGDMICDGTIEDPCLAFINFSANEDIFIYQTGYDPWGRNTTFEFDPNIKEWKLQRSWGRGWRNIPLDRPCTGTWCGLSNKDDTRKFSVAFREGKDYQIRIVAYKNNPSDTIKWSAFDGKVDPTWHGIPEGSLMEYEDNYKINKTGIEQKLNLSIDRINNSCFNITIYPTEEYINLADLSNKDLTKFPIKDRKKDTKLDISKGNKSFISCDYTPNKITKGLNLELGWNSVQIDSAASTLATAYGVTENMCIDPDGIFHVAYRGSAYDLYYSNSSDNGNTWSTKLEIVNTETILFAQTNCLPNGSIIVTFFSGDTDHLYFVQSTNSGAQWGSKLVLEDDLAIFKEVGFDVDSNSIVHYCATDTSEDLSYGNTSLVDGGKEISPDYSDHCDLTTDVDDNIYIVISESLTDDLDIMSSKDGFSTRNTIDEGLGGVISTIGYGLAVAIQDNGSIHIASSQQYDLQYCMGNVDDWNGGASDWGCIEIDSTYSVDPSIAVNDIGDVFITYSSSANDDGDIYLINKTVGNAWSTRKQLPTQSSSGLGSLADSLFATSNRADDGKLHLVYTYSADLYYMNVTIPYGSPADSTAPTVTLISPVNGTNHSTSNSVDFKYSAIDDTAVTNCTLYINETYNTSNDGSSNFTSVNIGNGYYHWSVNCSDAIPNWGYSGFFNLTVDYSVSADSCSCPASGDWIVDCSDNCVITSACDLGTNDLIINGDSGSFTLNSKVIVRKMKVENQCRVKFDGKYLVFT